MAKTVIKCGGVTLAVEAVGPEVRVTVAKGVFVFTEALTPEQALQLWKALEEAEMEAFCVWSKNTKGGLL